MDEPETLLVPDDFRAFMKHVVAVLDGPPSRRIVDGEEAIKFHCGYGGRIDHAEAFRFWYITRDGQHKWEIVLREPAIRDIADGLQVEVDGYRHEIARTKARVRTGSPLLIWGEYGDDALRTRDERQLIDALDHLHASSLDGMPRALRMWSTADDQIYVVFNGDWCALYVVESLDGYATSCGDSKRNDSFEVLDHDGRPLLIPWADCIPWERARNAVLRFMDKGDLGPEVATEGRIPSMLLMMGDVDRKAALAARAEAPRELTRSSLPRMITPIPDDTQDQPLDTVEIELPEAPPSMVELDQWARRLLDHLYTRELIELSGTNTNLEELTYHLSGLLQAHGLEAQESIDTADWLANEIGAVRGVKRMFATGGDLQIALRRSRFGTEPAY